MPEILTESFCERCGTRYTFESSAPRSSPLTGIKVFGSGLKNFVMSDDTSMDEAMAAARSDAERKATTQQLDAFHKTFNFCMTCRQYTCANCWNEAEARCLTCAPHLGREIMPAPFPTIEASGTEAPAAPPAEHAHEPAVAFESAPAAWPEMDMPTLGEAELPPPSEELEAGAPEEIDLAARLRTLELGGAAPPEEAAAAEAEPVEVAAAAGDAVEAEPVEEAAAAEDAVEAEPVEAEPVEVAAPAGDAVEAEPVEEVDDLAAAARARTASLLGRFRPGQSLDEALEQFEREQAAAEAAAMSEVAETPEPKPVAAAEAERVAAAVPEPEPVAEAEAEPEPEPVTAAPEPEPQPVATAPEPVAAEPAIPRPAADDRIEQPTWPVRAPQEPTAPHAAPPADEQPSLPAAATSAPTPEWPSEPQWPAQPQWPSQGQWPPASPRPSDGTILGRPVVPSGGIDALWAASSGEVLGQVGAPMPTGPSATPVGVQPCVNCGLSLSATARFCRRCGTAQVSA